MWYNEGTDQGVEEGSQEGGAGLLVLGQQLAFGSPAFLGDAGQGDDEGSVQQISTRRQVLDAGENDRPLNVKNHLIAVGV